MHNASNMTFKHFVFFACNKLGTENLMKYLISKGADVNATDKDERSPLHLCADAGKSLDTILIAGKMNYSI